MFIVTMYSSNALFIPIFSKEISGIQSFEWLIQYFYLISDIFVVDLIARLAVFLSYHRESNSVQISSANMYKKCSFLFFLFLPLFLVTY